jgi:hypothetical protein
MNSASSVSLIFLLVAGMWTPTAAQMGMPQYPLSADVESLDGIIRAFYEVVSTPAGALPDRGRDASLHAPGAKIQLSHLPASGVPALEVLTLNELYDRYYGAPRDKPFYEREIHRVTQQFGNIAHVWSTYVVSDTPGGAPRGRGISSIHLYFDGLRWWITGWMDEGEHAGRPLPSEFLPLDQS